MATIIHSAVSELKLNNNTIRDACASQISDYSFWQFFFFTYYSQNYSLK